jgi:hypothetical protein
MRTTGEPYGSRVFAQVGAGALVHAQIVLLAGSITQATVVPDPLGAAPTATSGPVCGHGTIGTLDCAPAELKETPKPVPMSSATSKPR